jgi:hypothetical protein
MSYRILYDAPSGDQSAYISDEHGTWLLPFFFDVFWIPLAIRSPVRHFRSTTSSRSD